MEPLESNPEKDAEVVGKKFSSVESEVERKSKIAMTNLGVEEIVKAINEAVPFQAKNIAKSYEGIVIRMTGYFHNVQEDHRNKKLLRVELRTKYDPLSLYSIWLRVDPEEFPEVKILKRGSQVSVTGEIERASGQGLYISILPQRIEVEKYA